MTLIDLPDVDVTSPLFFARPDYFDILARLRADGPVRRSTPDTWMVSRYEDIRAISRDPGRFSSARGVIINDPARRDPRAMGTGSVIHMDPPDHSAYRKLVNGEFTPRAVGRLEDAVRATVRGVLDEVPPGEEIDAVSAVTAPIPVLVIAALLGIGDGDLADFRRWSDAMIEFSDSPSDEGHVAGLELFEFLGRHIDSRYEQPGDDLISLLTAGAFRGEALAREQILMFCLTLLVAGNETTRHLLSGGLQVLAEHPEQRVRLAADPALIPQAVEEMLRWITPIQAMGRTALTDLEFGGQAIAEGDYLVMLYASGNRDEQAFGPTADRFDVGRPVSPTHVAFGFGEHLCLGAPLARLEARVFWEEMLARFPHFEVGGGEMTVSTLVRGPRTMPVVLSPQ
jgi:cytochrome P450